jgi:hypothetical protein
MAAPWPGRDSPARRASVAGARWRGHYWIRKGGCGARWRGWRGRGACGWGFPGSVMRQRCGAITCGVCRYVTRLRQATADRDATPVAFTGVGHGVDDRRCRADIRRQGRRLLYVEASAWPVSAEGRTRRTTTALWLGPSLAARHPIRCPREAIRAGRTVYAVDLHLAVRPRRTEYYVVSPRVRSNAGPNAGLRRIFGAGAPNGWHISGAPLWPILETETRMQSSTPKVMEFAKISHTGRGDVCGIRGHVPKQELISGELLWYYCVHSRGWPSGDKLF